MDEEGGEIDSEPILCEHLVGFHELAGFCYLNICCGYCPHPALNPCFKPLNIPEMSKGIISTLLFTDERTKTGEA